MSGPGQDNRPPAHGYIHPEQMRALVMTAPWSFDDTKPTVDAAFRNKIPTKYKKDGVFHLGTGMEGLLADVKGDWGRALFFRDSTQFPGKYLNFLAFSLILINGLNSYGSYESRSNRSCLAVIARPALPGRVNRPEP